MNIDNLRKKVNINNKGIGKENNLISEMLSMPIAMIIV